MEGERLGQDVLLTAHALVVRSHVLIKTSRCNNCFTKTQIMVYKEMDNTFE